MKRLIKFAILGGIVTFLTGLVYVTMQQNYRQNANDPQIQLAQDTASSMAINRPVSLTGPVEMSTSLAPFIMIFDAKGKPSAWSGTLNGKIVTPPSGVFEAAKTYGEDRVTWQPGPHVRIAAVIVPIDEGKKGYVLAGRSLLEVEKRENSLLVTTGILWAASLFLCGMFVLL